MAEKHLKNPSGAMPDFNSSPEARLPSPPLSPGQLARLMWVRNFVRRGTYESPDVVDAVIDRLAEQDASAKRNISPSND